MNTFRGGIVRSAIDRPPSWATLTVGPDECVLHSPMTTLTYPRAAVTAVHYRWPMVWRTVVWFGEYGFTPFRAKRTVASLRAHGWDVTDEWSPRWWPHR